MKVRMGGKLILFVAAFCVVGKIWYIREQRRIGKESESLKTFKFTAENGILRSFIVLRVAFIAFFR